MFGLGKLWTTVANLVATLNNLNTTFGEINTGLRTSLRLDDHDDQVLAHKTDALEPARNGRRKAVEQ